MPEKTVQQVIALLEQNKDERGIKHWEKAGARRLKSFGIGVTKLKKLAKQVGRDHDLAVQLWEEPYFDARLLACMIDQPKQVTQEQVERQLKDADFWMLTHTYCQVLLSKTPFALAVAVKWAKQKNKIRRRCAYLLLYHLAKNDKTLDDGFFEPYLQTIGKTLQQEENYVRDAMNGALWGIGMRNKNLNKRALAVAKKIGTVEVDYGDNSCEAIDCVKHLTAPSLQKRLQ